MNHFDCFGMEMLREVLIKNMIPDRIKELELDDETDTVAYELLRDCVICPPTYNSVLRWLHTMGFTY